MNPEFLKTLVADLEKVKTLLRGGKTIDAYLAVQELQAGSAEILKRLGVKTEE